MSSDSQAGNGEAEPQKCPAVSASSVSDEAIGVALRAWNTKPGYSHVERMRAALEAVRSRPAASPAIPAAGDDVTVTIPRKVAEDYARGSWVMADYCVGESPSTNIRAALGAALASVAPTKETRPIPVVLFCPQCLARHVDEGEWATKLHRTHLCASCGSTWRAAPVPTVGVADEPTKETTDGE